MEILATKSLKAFKFSCVSFLLILTSIVILVANDKLDLELPKFIIGGGFMLAGILGFVGWIYNIKGIKEPITYQKVIALLFNSFFVLLLIAFILGDLFGA